MYIKVCVLGCVDVDKQMRDEEVGMKGGCGSCGECMHGRGIICNHPVARITGTLTSTSPFRIALKRGPSILFYLIACTHISANKNVTRERHAG